MVGKLNQTKLMLIGRELEAIARKWSPDNEAEAVAIAESFLGMAVTVAASYRGLACPPPVRERLLRAAQDELNEAIDAETGRKRR